MSARALKFLAATKLPALAIFCLALPAVAQVNYGVYGSTAYVSNSPSASGNIVIASTYEGLPVTSIGTNAFYNCTSLTGIIIPDSVTNIDPGAFEACSSLTSFIIPDSVTSIGDSTFYECSALTNIVIGTNVTSIGAVAFQFCHSLTSVIIPNSVINISEDAFTSCTSLTNLVIGNSVTNIGAAALYGCSSLTSAIIPNSVTTIGIDAFYECSSLTSITIPDNVSSIGLSAFLACTSLTNINVGAGNAFYSSTNGVLFDKNKSTLVEFPGGIEGSYAIPDIVTTIDTNAFYDCTNLTGITIPSSVASIDGGAFQSSGLTSVTIPDSVTNIGTSAFRYCFYLTSATIPDSVTSIGNNVFFDCVSLANVVVGSGITNIANTGLFALCGSLTSVTFQGNAPTANSSVFSGDTNVTVYYTPGTAGWDTFASTTGVSVAPSFGSTAYGGFQVIYYPTNGAARTLQMSTNSASGNWVTVSNAVALASLQLTNPPAAGYFRLQSSSGSPPNPGLVIYFKQPVLFYPTNAAYSLWMATNLSAPDWTAPSGSAFISEEVTNAPPGAVFRLY